MIEKWVEDETKTLNLKDKRLSGRLKLTLNYLAKQPNKGIPNACNSHSVTTGTYRFLNNRKVTIDQAISPHKEATRNRIAEYKVVLLPSDTTELDLSRPSSKVEGVGPLSKGVRHGLFLHLMLATNESGLPLGVINYKIWNRENDKNPEEQTRYERLKIPIEEKESYRWLECKKIADELAREYPDTQFISLYDSESDIYEMLSKGSGANWIIRSCQNRKLINNTGENSTNNTAYNNIERLVQEASSLYEIKVQVRKRVPKILCETRKRKVAREPRTALCEVCANVVTIKPPYRPGNEKIKAVEVNVVIVREKHPPPREIPIEWVLLTDLEIDTPESVQRIIDLYSQRWNIEMYFKVLKSGCRIEKRRFETKHAFCNCLALYMITAWRILYISHLSRVSPDESCEVVFSHVEWQALQAFMKIKPISSNPPTIKEMVYAVAKLGGYIQRKTSPPGAQTLWRGMQILTYITQCWVIFGHGGTAT